MHPNKTLASTSNTSGEKVSKERVSIGCCCNATGTDNVKPMAIGKAKRPRCFGKENQFNPNQYLTRSIRKRG